MKTNEMIDEFIDKLVLSFNNNEIVSNFIKKLRDMEHAGDVTVEGNTIICANNSQTREITVDILKRTILTKDYGEKVTHDKRSAFSNEVHYNENGLKSHCYKTNVINELTQFDNKTIIKSDSYSSTITLNEGKRVFTNITKSNKYAEKNRHGDYIVLQKDDSKKDFYLLANGDVLKVVNKDGNEKYYYCDSSEMFVNNNDSGSSKAKFCVELSYKDAEKILNNLGDAFNLINNDTIFDIRGRMY